LDEVQYEEAQNYITSAKSLIETFGGAEKAMAAALAYISGVTDIKSRSAITMQCGFVTYLCLQDHVLDNCEQVREVLARNFDESVMSSIQCLHMCEHRMGCVFDVPSDKIDAIEAMWNDDEDVILKQISKLPELSKGELVPSYHSSRRSSNHLRGHGQTIVRSEGELVCSHDGELVPRPSVVPAPPHDDRDRDRVRVRLPSGKGRGKRGKMGPPGGGRYKHTHPHKPRYGARQGENFKKWKRQLKKYTHVHRPKIGRMTKDGRYVYN